MVELNPDHPVTKQVHDQWHKVVAILMNKMGIKSFTITMDDVKALPPDSCVMFDTKQDPKNPDPMAPIEIRLITNAEAMELMKKEQGQAEGPVQ